MIKVQKPGLYTTVQDLGRKGYRNVGVPVSGVMDEISAGFANALLNNSKNAAVLEITMTGPVLEFLNATEIVISGAEMSPALNGVAIQNNKVYTVSKGDVVSFGRLVNGFRTYLSVKGGLSTEIVLGSRSYYNGITSQTKLQKNDLVAIAPFLSRKTEKKGSIFKSNFFETSKLDVFPGPELDLFTPDEQIKLLATVFTVSNRMNRMGYHLEEMVVKHSKSIITSPVIPGTIQLTPSGQLIILMKDAQTTGGYPRIFQLSQLAIAKLSQKKAGDRVQLKWKDY